MHVEYDALTVERLGHASVRIATDDGLVGYIDPWSDVLANDPRDGDVVFVTHDDVDHYDPAGIEAVARLGATVVAYGAIDTSDLDLEIITVPYGGSRTVRGIGVEAVPAHNRTDGPHVDEDGDPFHAEREVVGFLFDIAGTTVYFTSDTDVLPEHESIRADVFIPPIGGHFTIDRHAAADFAKSVEADLVLPVHYDTFETIETDVEAFAEDVEARGIAVEPF